MKINIGNTTLAGYTNTENFDLSIVDDFEIEEILADGVINLIPIENLQQTLSIWVLKLKTGGKLVTSFNDIYDMAALLINRNMKEPDINNILYGYNRKGIYSCEFIEQVLKSMNMKISNKSFSGIKVTLVAEKV